MTNLTNAFRVAALAASFALAGCYSFAQTKHRQLVTTDDSVVEIDLWVNETGFLSDRNALVFGSGDFEPRVWTRTNNAFMSVVLWPVDVLASTFWAIRAPFDSSYDIRHGSFGAVAGIVLPGVTLFPHPFWPPIPKAKLARPEFDQFVQRLSAGDGVAAYLELVGPALWDSTKLPIARVELVSQ